MSIISENISIESLDLGVGIGLQPEPQNSVASDSVCKQKNPEVSKYRVRRPVIQATSTAVTGVINVSGKPAIKAPSRNQKRKERLKRKMLTSVIPKPLPVVPVAPTGSQLVASSVGPSTLRNVDCEPMPEMPLPAPLGAGVAKIASNRKRCVAHLLQQPFPVWEEDKNLKKKLAELKIPIVEVKTPLGEAPHPVSAAVRRHLTAAVLARLVELGFDTIASLWGSQRDLRIAKAAAKASGYPLELKLHRPFVVAGDANRIVGELETEVDIPIAPAAIMVNVYSLGQQFGEDRPLTPENMAEFMKLHNFEALVWLGHKFDGVCGSVFGEGAWYRKLDGDIIAKPDVFSAHYEHPPCDWIHASGVQNGIARVCIQNSGPFTAVLFRQVDAPDQLPKLSENSQGFFKTVVPLPNMLGWSFLRPYIPWPVLSLLPKKQVVVDVCLLTALRVWLLRKGRTGLVFTQMLSYATTTMFQDKKLGVASYATVLHVFPHKYSEIVWDTALFAYTEKVSEREADLWALRSVQAPVMADYTRHLTDLGQPLNKAVSFPWRTAAKVAGFTALGIAACYCIYRTPQYLRASLSAFKRITVKTYMPIELVSKLKVPWVDSPPPILPAMNVFTPVAGQLGVDVSLEQVKQESASELFSVTVGPLIEEFVKRFRLFGIPVGTLAIVCAEYKHWAQKLGPIPALRVYWPAACVHALTTYMPYSWACISHSAWNSYVLYRNRVHKAVIAHSLVAACMPGLAELLWKNGFSEDPPELNKYVPLLKPTLSHTRWRSFVMQMHEAPWVDRVWEKTTGFSYFLPDEGVVRTQPHASVFEVIKDPLITVVGSRPPFESEYSTSQMWVLLGHSVAMYAPAGTDHNLMVTVDSRLLKLAPYRALEIETGEFLVGEVWGSLCDWRKAKARHCEICSAEKLSPVMRSPARTQPMMCWSEMVVPWIEKCSTTVQKKRYERELQIIRSSGWPAKDHHCGRTVALMVKRDEVLLKTSPPDLSQRTEFFYQLDEAENLIASHQSAAILKPRPIANVHPMFQVLVGPFVDEAATRLSRVWDGITDFSPFCVQYSVSMCYLKNPTDWALSEWWKTNLETLDSGVPSFNLIVSGDDSLVLYCDGKGFEIAFEADASMFDQSQSVSCLEYEYKVLLWLGVPSDIVDRLRGLSAGKYMVRYRSGDAEFLDLSKRPMRHTGGPDTTLGNTIVMGSAWYNVIVRLAEALAPTAREVVGLDVYDSSIRIELLKKEFMRLGFDMKLKIHRSWCDSSFLKGMWYCADDELDEPNEDYYWAPLPSRVLKMGKTLTNPLQQVDTDNYEVAARRVLSAQCESYASFRSVPILQSLVLNFATRTRFMQAYPMKRCVGLERHQVVSTSTSMLNMYRALSTGAYLQIAKRYDTTLAEIASLEHILQNVDAFAFVEHPLMFQMAKVDYS